MVRWRPALYNQKSEHDMSDCKIFCAFLWVEITATGPYILCNLTLRKVFFPKLEAYKSLSIHFCIFCGPLASLAKDNFILFRYFSIFRCKLQICAQDTEKIKGCGPGVQKICAKDSPWNWAAMQYIFKAMYWQRFKRSRGLKNKHVSRNNVNVIKFYLQKDIFKTV